MDMDRPASRGAGCTQVEAKPGRPDHRRLIGHRGRACPRLRRRTATRWCLRRAARRSSPRSPTRIRDRRPSRAAYPSGRPRARRRCRVPRAGTRCAQSRAGVSGQQCGLWPARPGARRSTAHDQLAMIDLNCRSLTDLSLRFDQQPRAPSRRHPQRRVDLGLHPGPRHVGLQRHQGLRDLVQRGAAARAASPRASASPRSAPARCRPNSRRAPASWTCTIRAGSTAPPRTSRAQGYRGLMRGTAASWCPARTTSSFRGCRASCRAASSPARSTAACAAGRMPERLRVTRPRHANATSFDPIRKFLPVHAINAARSHRARIMDRVIVALRTFLTLALPYFRSEDRWRARALLAGVIGAELGLVYVAVTVIQWNARFFNALEARDWDGFKRELFVFGLHHARRDRRDRLRSTYFGQTLHHPLAALADRALRRDLDGGGPPLPPALRRQHGRQHPSAHRQRRAAVPPAHARARHRAAQQRGRAVLLRVHPVGPVRDDAAAALRHRSGVPRLSDLDRARLCGHRHAGRAPDRLAADPAAILAAALRIRISASRSRASPTMPSRSR